MSQRGVIKRVEKGKYALPDTDPLVISTNLVYPSYISFLSGLAYHHKTTQIPVVIQVVTPKPKKQLNINGEIRFIIFDKKRVFGYRKEKISDGYVFIGEIEKIIVDGLFMPEYCPIEEIAGAIEEVENLSRLLEYADKMNSIVLLKRLGYLLSLCDIDVYEKLKTRLNKRYDLLNPLLPPSGRKIPDGGWI